MKHPGTKLKAFRDKIILRYQVSAVHLQTDNCSWASSWGKGKMNSRHLISSFSISTFNQTFTYDGCKQLARDSSCSFKAVAPNPHQEIPQNGIPKLKIS